MIAFLLLPALCFPPGLRANPTGGEVVAGQATISTSGSTLTVNQASDHAIIHWQDFSISAGHTTTFVQPSATSAALNRVTGGNPSAIHGTLQSNGQIYLINPNGVLVGKNGVVNTGGFLASTLDVSDGDFLAGGDLRFSGGSTASVVNLGQINGSTSDVILIAHTVENHGSIDAPRGTAALAAGSEVLVKASGQERVFVEAGSSSGTSSATQAGLIRAAAAEIKAAGGNEYALAIKHSGVTRATGVRKQGGRVYLSAGGKGGISNSGTISARKGKGGGGQVKVAAGGNVANTGTIDVSGKKGGKVEIAGQHVGNTGLILADGAVGSGGEVKLSASPQGVLIHSGAVSASGYSQGQKGGRVEMTGGEVAVAAGSVVNASGDGGGGTVLIGGDYQGGNAVVPNARNTYVEEGSLIIADAVTSGNGGKVILWADENTYFGGSIFARGGAVSGDGGFVETSGKANLAFRGWVDAGAANGVAGTLLLDPKNIIIQDEILLANPNILVFDNPSIVDSAGGSSAESDNLQAAIGNLGYAFSLTTATSGFSTLLSGVDIFVIPEQEIGSLASALSTSEREAIADWVADGGRILIHGTGNNWAATLFNAIFGYEVASVNTSSFTTTLQSSAIFTQFEAGPATLPWNNGTYTLSTTNLPDHLSHIYTNGNFSSVFVGTEGSGKVGFLAYDWYNAFPIGSQDGGWHTTLGNMINELRSNQVVNYTFHDEFAENPAATITLSPFRITAITNAGTSIVLQANNDITVNSAIVTNNLSGDGGAITMQAGRSILLNANITTDNGDLTLVANETLGNGVFDAHRDAGNAVITMASGVKIDAGTGAVTITLADGAGKTNVGSGAITLRDIDAGTLTVSNLGNGTAADIELRGALAIAGAVNLTANRSIIGHSGASVTTQGGDIVVNADRDETGGGNIQLTDTTVTSNGGNITLGGGADPLATAAIGTNTGGDNIHGIYLNNSKLTAAGGDISLRGTGAAAADAHGIHTTGPVADDPANRTEVTTTGAGTITWTGLGAAGTTGNIGIALGNPSLVQVENGNLTMTGTGGLSTNTDTNSVGISTGFYSSIRSTGSGDIILTGTGLRGGGAAGIFHTGEVLSTGSGNISLVGNVLAGGSGFNRPGIWVIYDGRIRATGSGDISLNGTSAVTTGVQGGVVLSHATIRTDEGTGDITIQGTHSTKGIAFDTTHYFATNTPVVVNSGGNITFTTDRPAFDSNTSGGSANATVSGAGTLLLQPLTPSATMGIAGGAGTFNLSAAQLDKFQDGFSEIIVGRADSSGAMDVRGYTFKDNLILRTPTGTGDITLNGALATGSGSQAGTITLQAGRSIIGTSGGGRSVTTQGQAIELNADRDAVNGGNIQLTGTTITSNGGAIVLGGGANPLTTAAIGFGMGSEAEKAGIYLSGGSINAGAGTVNLRGQGVAGTGNSYGIRVLGGAVIGNMAATGAITLHGTGGAVTAGSGLSYNDGIYMTGGSAVRAAQGAILLTGIGNGGGAGGSDHFGVHINGATVQSHGTGANAATVTLTGQGGLGTSLNNDVGTRGYGIGVYLASSAATQVKSADGNISITGTGANAGGQNSGVYVSGLVESTGTATVNVTGTGGNGAGNNYGVYVAGSNGIVRSTFGDVTITGTGGSGGNGNLGLIVNSNARVQSIGTGANAAKLFLNGTGGAGVGTNQGIYMTSNGRVTSTAGAISLTGVGQGSGANNHGIYIFSSANNGAVVESLGSATVTLHGTGSTTGTGTNHGVFLTDSGTTGTTHTALTSVDGAISITGTGNGSAAGNYGVHLAGGAVVNSTGAATVTLAGTGGAGTDTNVGVYLTGTNTAVNSGYGNIGITGVGGAGTVTNYGVYLSSGAKVNSTGTGANAATITLNGTGGAGSGGNNYGTYLIGNPSSAGVSSIDGNITVNGTGGAGTSSNYGVVMTWDSFVESTGTTGDAATITLNGTGAGAAGSNHGFYVREAGAQVRSQVGAIAYTGIGAGTSGNGIHFAGGSSVQSGGTAPITMTATGSGATDFYATGSATAIGGAASTGDITINANTIDWGATALTLRSNGALLIQPRTATTSIGLGNSATGTLNLTAAELDGILDGFASITIGHAAGSGAMDVRSYTFKDNLILRTPTGTGDISLNGALATGSGTEIGTITLQAGRRIVGNTGASVTTQAQAINLNADRDATGGGNIELYGTAITSNGGAITIGGGLNPAITAAIGYSNATEGNKTGVFLSGSTINSGAGTISLRGQGLDSASSRGFGVDVADNSSVVSTTGAINVHGIGGGGAGGSAAHSNVGISLRNGGSNITSQNGNIHLVGQGGTGVTSGTTNFGILVDSNATVTSTGTGTLTLEGTGGGNDANTNFGTGLRNGGKVIGTGSGAILVKGQGGYGSVGIYLEAGGQILSQGTSTITLEGIGGTTGAAGSSGVYLTGSNTKVESASGNIRIEGQGGTVNAANNHGITLAGAAAITSIGAGTLTLIGDGGAGTSDNYGIHLRGSGTRVQSAQGAILFEGTGGDGSGSFNHGIFLNAGAKVVSTNTATITLDGEGGKNGFIKNHGVFLTGAGTAVESLAGDIQIDGQGGTGTGDSNQATGVGNRSNHHGVSLEAGAQVTSTGTSSGAAATITIEGTGGHTTVTLGTALAVTGPPAMAAQGYAQNHGINVEGAATKIASAYGDIALTGQGGTHSGGHASSLRGVYIAGATVESTGTGAGAANLSIVGTGTAGTGQDQGVFFSSSAKALSVDGNITMNGHGNVGLLLGGTAATQIKSTGAGNLHLIGTAPGTANGIGHYGPATIESNTGDITIETDRLFHDITTAVPTIESKGNGRLFIQPRTATTSIGIGNGAVGTTLNWTTAQLDGIQDGFASITIGHASGSGAVDVRGYTFKDNLTIRTPGSGGSIALNGALATGAGPLAGSITLLAGRNITGVAAGSVVTQAGDITLHAAGNGAGDSVGISLNGSILRALGTGNISLTGYGTGTGTNLHGIHAINGAKVEALGDGTVTLTGQGSSTGTANNHGVWLTGNNTAVTSVNGNIGITGVGGGSGTGATNYGIHLDGGAKVASTGTTSDAATVTLNGTGGSGSGGSHYGVHLIGAGGSVSSGYGDISITGNGGGTGNGNYGIIVQNSGSVLSTGTGANAAKVSLTGFGSATGGNDNHGIRLTGANARVGSVDGAIEITGTGRGNGSGNHGITAQGGAVVESTGTNAATVKLTGTGSASGTSGNHGVQLSDANTAVRSRTGNIEIIGNENGIAGGNHGINILGGARVESTALAADAANAASITLKGYGGKEASNHGVNIDGSSTVIRSGYGDIKIEGFGGASATANNGKRGVYISNAASIVSDGTGTDAAKIMIEGTGGTGGGQEQGVYLNNARINSVDGDIWLKGNGRTTASSHGLMIYNGSQVTATGSADIRLTGDGSGSIGSISFFNGGSGTSAFTSHTGDIIIESDTWHGNTTGSLSSTGGPQAGDLIIKPLTASTDIGIGGGSGTLSISADHLGMIQDGFSEIYIGHEDGTGIVNVGTYTNFKDNLTIRTPRGNGTINVNGALATGSGAYAGSITLEAGLNILATAGSSIRTDGRTITLNSDRDRGQAGDTVGGRIALASATIESKGGDIVLGGGGDPLNEAADNSGAAGGSRGIHLTGSAKIDSGAGNISMRGKGADVTGHRGIELHDTSSVVSTSGNIFMHGQGGNPASGTQQMGISIRGSVTSASGDIDITGIGGSNSSGMLFWNAAKVETGAGRTITLTGIAQGSAADFYVWNDNLGQKATFGNAGGAAANVVVNANTLSFESVATEFKSGGTLTFQPRTAGQAINIAGTTAGLALTTDRLAAIADGFSEVVIGSTIAGDITVAGAATFTDNLRLIGNGTLAINGALNVGANRLVLLPAGNTTQSAAITAGNLRLGGNGNFTLEHASNNIGTLAKDGTGSVSLRNAGALTVGSVDTINGVTGSTVDLRALTGNLTLNQAVTGTGSGSYAVALSTTANFINNAGANAVQTPSSRWLVYSNAPAGNTFGGLNSGQGALYNRTATSHAPGGISEGGNRYLFSTTPSLTVTATLTDSKTYGDTYVFPAPLLGTHYTVTGFVDAGAHGNVFTQDDASTILSGAPTLDSLGVPSAANASVTPYTVTIAQGTLANTAGYGFTFTSGGGITVTQRAITLMATAASKTYGDADPTLAVSVTGGSLGGSDTLADVTGTLARQGGENVGNYDILLGSGTKASNYAITFNADNDAFSITQRAITLTADAATKIYGDADPALSVSITGGSLGSVSVTDSLFDVTGTLSRQSGENVGDYDILIGTGAKAGNYAITFNADNDAFSITQRAITLTADAATKIYGDADPALSVSITGGSLGSVSVTDSLFDVTGALSRQSGENVGLYDILLGTGTKASNYAITFNADNDAFSITPKALTITANDQSKPYGILFTFLGTEFTSSGLINGDTVDGVDLASAGTAATAAMGLYPIAIGNATGTGLGNYDITYAGGQFTVRPATGEPFLRSDHSDPFGFLFRNHEGLEDEEEDEGKGKIEYEIPGARPGAISTLSSGEVE